MTGGRGGCRAEPYIIYTLLYMFPANIQLRQLESTGISTEKHPQEWSDWLSQSQKARIIPVVDAWVPSYLSIKHALQNFHDFSPFIDDPFMGHFATVDS